MPETWTDLIHACNRANVPAPGLRLVTLAQWALDSSFGTAPLARAHRNYGALKFRARVNADRQLATPVDIDTAHGTETFCAFPSLDAFIAGYWAFVDGGEMYAGWRDFADDPAGFIAHLHRGGYSAAPDYVARVLELMPTVRQQAADAGATSLLTDDPVAAKRTRVAVLVGHNTSARGAFSEHMQVSEWPFNKRVAREMERLDNEFGLEAKTFFREPNPHGYGAEIAVAYAQMDAWDPAAIVELHFNSGGGHGCEVLHWRTSNQGRQLADAVCAAVVDELRLPDRGPKGRGDGERGSTSLRASSRPTILTEPFFGDSSADCARMLALGEEPLARAYLIGVRDGLAV